MMGKGQAVLEETTTCEHNVRRAPVATATDTLQTSSRISLWARTKVFWTKAPSRSSRASKACCTACFTLHVACAVKTQPLQSPRLPSRRHALSRTAAECAAAPYASGPGPPTVCLDGALSFLLQRDCIGLCCSTVCCVAVQLVDRSQHALPRRVRACAIADRSLRRLRCRH